MWKLVKRFNKLLAEKGRCQCLRAPNCGRYDSCVTVRSRWGESASVTSPVCLSGAQAGCGGRTRSGEGNRLSFWYSPGTSANRPIRRWVQPLICMSAPTYFSLTMSDLASAGTVWGSHTNRKRLHFFKGWSRRGSRASRHVDHHHRASWKPPFLYTKRWQPSNTQL